MKYFSQAVGLVLIVTVASYVEAQLPQFNFTLTSKSADERRNICAQNMAYCTTDCGGIDQAPMNFCNITTMAWGCGCKSKIPDYEGYEWPVNSAHCRGSGEACKAACKDNTCIEACNNAWAAKCGTPQQPPAYYKTEDPSQIPTYNTPPKANTTSSNGSSSNSSDGKGGNSTGGNGTAKGTSGAASQFGAAYSLGSAISALAVVAVGMMML